MSLWTLIWTRPIRVLAMLGVTLLSTNGDIRLFSWVSILVVFIVTHEIRQSISYYGGRGRTLRANEDVQHRILRLITDLSGLSGRQYHLWVADIYLPRRYFFEDLRSSIASLRTLLATLVGRDRTVVKFVRELSCTLEDAREIPRESSHRLFGDSFLHRERRLWWDVSLAESSSISNQWVRLTPAENDALCGRYGAIIVSPIMDRRKEDCRGLLVVHVGRDTIMSTMAVGVFSQASGQRRLSETCNDIYNYLYSRAK